MVLERQGDSEEYVEANICFGTMFVERDKKGRVCVVINTCSDEKGEHFETSFLKSGNDGSQYLNWMSAGFGPENIRRILGVMGTEEVIKAFIAGQERINSSSQHIEKMRGIIEEWSNRGPKVIRLPARIYEQD